MNTIKFYVFVTAAFVFICRSNILAFDPKDYEQRLISDVVQSEWEKRQGRDIEDSLRAVINTTGETFYDVVKWNGKKRKIDKQNVLWWLVINSRKDGFENYFTYEILVRDSDRKEYWIPIQDTHLVSLEKECKQCKSVKLYLLFFACTQKQSLIVVNEFAVDED